MTAKIERGLKFHNILERAKFENDSKTQDWINSQPAILEDIKEYKESLPKAEKSVPLKSKAQKEK